MGAIRKALSNNRGSGVAVLMWGVVLVVLVITVLGGIANQKVLLSQRTRIIHAVSNACKAAALQVDLNEANNMDKIATGFIRLADSPNQSNYLDFHDGLANTVATRLIAINCGISETQARNIALQKVIIYPVYINSSLRYDIFVLSENTPGNVNYISTREKKLTGATTRTPTNATSLTQAQTIINSSLSGPGIKLVGGGVPYDPSKPLIREHYPAYILILNNYPLKGIFTKESFSTYSVGSGQLVRVVDGEVVE